MSEKTEWQKWINRRAAAVRSKFTAYDALSEHGFGEAIPDEHTPVQIFCPFHTNVNTPAARYYPSDGSHADYVRCYRCKENWDSLNLYSKFRGLDWYEALKDLERRFQIKLPKRPDGEEIKEPIPKTSSVYESEQWADTARMLVLLEKKLLRTREKASLIDFVKFCRVIDTVKWDYDHNGNVSTPDMASVLKKCHDMMNDVMKRKTLDFDI